MWETKVSDRVAYAETSKNENAFYVVDPNNSFKHSEVGVVYPTDGRKPFLRTYADGDWNDNLLALPHSAD